MKAMKAMKAMKKVSARLEAPRLRWQGRQDRFWFEEVGPHQEQEWQDCQQEEERTRQGQPVACRSQGRSCSPEDQGLLRHQEGVAAVQQGQGALQEVSSRKSCAVPEIQVVVFLRYVELGADRLSGFVHLDR